MNVLKSTLCIAALCAVSYFNAQSLQLDLAPFATDVNDPVDIAHAGDDRLFVVEQNGFIRIVQPDGTVNSTPFLNVSGVSSCCGERGLLGLAFHPDYSENGFFYINFTDNSGDTQISRFSVSSDPDVADASSRVDIISIDQTFGNHNGGCLRFGPDGMLYVGMGDGGSGNDPMNDAQNINSLLGKMLRIDIDGEQPYSVPDDNPFVGEAPRDEIWAIGLRNPWKFNFDTQTGDMWIGDVGQNAIEEVDFEPAGIAGGLNYGWRCYEGDDANILSGCNGEYVFPVSQYSHAGGACSITGGLVYRGEDNLDMQGLYFNVDYCSGVFRSVQPDGAGGWDTDVVATNSGTPGFGWTTFGVDANNEMYAANKTTDVVYRVIDADCVGYSSSFSVEGSTLTASAGTSYKWFLNGELIEGEISQVLNVDMTGEYAVRVANVDGCSSLSASTEVVVDSGCTGDITGDLVVDVNDLLSFNSAFNEPCDNCPEDLNGDGDVNVNDFLILNSAFGQSCD